MAPGQVHTWNFNGDEKGYIVNFDLEYFQSFLLKTDYLDRFTFLSGKNSNMIWTIANENQKEICSTFQKLYKLDKSATQTKDLVRVTLLQLLLLIDSWIDHDSKSPNSQYNYTLFQNYQKLVEKNFKTIRLPKFYAEELFITPNHLNAVCKSYLGIAAGEIIRERVVLEAKRLLINKRLNINEISTSLNFKDNSYFTKFFKKNTGLTPEEFRKNNS